MNKYIKVLQSISNELYPNDYHWDSLPCAYVHHVGLNTVVDEINEVLNYYVDLLDDVNEDEEDTAYRIQQIINIKCDFKAFYNI